VEHPARYGYFSTSGVRKEKEPSLLTVGLVAICNPPEPFHQDRNVLLTQCCETAPEPSRLNAMA